MLEVEARLEYSIAVSRGGVIYVTKLYREGYAAVLKLARERKREVCDVKALSHTLHIALVAPERRSPGRSTCANRKVEHILKGLCICHLEVRGKGSLTCTWALSEEVGAV